MGSLKADVRHAVRALVKAPVFTAVTVITLALGIGANSAMFSLVNAVLLRPLGYVEPERLMLIYEGFRGSAFDKVGVSPPDFVDLTTLQRSFSSIGAYRTQQYELSGAGEPEQITGVRVSASVFPILGVSAGTSGGRFSNRRISRARTWRCSVTGCGSDDSAATRTPSVAP